MEKPGSKTALRMTAQRRAILEALRAVTTHPTVEDLYKRVRRALPKISLGTVYRNLEVLSATGQIQRLEPCGTQMRFDGNPESHPHLRCLECGRVDDLHGLPAPDIEIPPHAAEGYEILGHCIEFLGRCPSCRTGKGRRSNS